jgi:hypothetical protein
MMIDCDACAARGPACGDCVVTVLLGAPPARRSGEGEAGIDLDGNEQAAIAVLAGSGLVPPLRLVAVSPEGGHRHGPGDRCPGPERNPPAAHHPDEQPGDGHRTAV